MRKLNTKSLERDYSSVRFILFIVSIFSLLSLILVHNFLYGFFFGGNGKNFSNFYLVNNFVKFSPITISFITLIFFGLFYFLSSLWKSIEFNKKIKSSFKSENIFIFILKNFLGIFFLALVIIMSVTMIMALSFSQDDSLIQNGLKYLVVMSISILLVSIFMFILWKLVYSIFINVSIFFITIFYNLNFFMFIKYISDHIFKLSKEYFFLSTFTLAVPIILIIVQIFSTLKDKLLLKKILHSLSAFSIFNLFLYFISFGKLPKWLESINHFFVDFHIMISIYIVYFLATIYTLYIVYKSKKDKGKLELKESDIIYKINKYGFLKVFWEIILEIFNFNKSSIYLKRKINESDDTVDTEEIIGSRKSYEMKMLISLAVLISFLLTSQLSLFTGYVVREIFISKKSQANFCIRYIDQNKKVNFLKNNFYMNNVNEIIYSDENWNFAVLKSDNYHLTTMNSASNCNHTN